MKKKMINQAHIEGKIYESTLEHKVSKTTNTPYIGGKLEVITDDAGLNTITVEFPYVAAKFSSGKENKNFAVLEQIISTGKTVVKNPGEAPTMVRIDPSISLNEWYKSEGDQDTLISTKRLSGGFIHIVNSVNGDETARNKFECDMVITNVISIEGNEESVQKEDKVVLKGGIFDFAGKLLPVEFSVTNPGGIKYFEDQIDPSPAAPVFTKVWGKIVNETIVETKTEESAFGEASVKEVKKSKRDWIVTGTAKEPYEFDDESTITAVELKEAMAARQVALSELLQAQKEREAIKKENENNNNAFGAADPTQGGFSF